MAADILNLFGDGARRAPLGALERHMLQQMSNTVDLAPVHCACDIDPKPDRSRSTAAIRSVTMRSPLGSVVISGSVMRHLHTGRGRR